MKNLKLKWKLLVSYGVIFLVLLVLGITSFSVMNMMSKKSVEYAEEIVPVVEEIGLARRNMISVQRYLLNAMIANSSEDYQRIQESMNTDREALYASLDTIEAINPDYATSIDSIREKLQGVSQYNAQIMELSQDFENAQVKEQAYDIYLNTYAPAFNEAADMIIALNDDTNQDVASQENLVKEVHTIAVVIVVIILILGLVAVVVFTGLMLRYIFPPTKKLL